MLWWISFIKSSFSISEIVPFNLWTELEGWGWGGGLFGLREGRLFVPHGQKLAVWLKKLDLHQLFMHFPREAVTACTLWLNVGGWPGWINWSGWGLRKELRCGDYKGVDARGRFKSGKWMQSQQEQVDEWIGQAGEGTSVWWILRALWRKSEGKVSAVITGRWME